RSVAGPRRLPAHVEQVGAVGHHPEALLHRPSGVGNAVAAEGIGGHVDDPHQVDAGAPGEAAAAEGGRHSGRIMLASMRLTELADGVPGARVESGPETEIRRVVQDSRAAGPGDLFVAVPGLTV